MFLGLTLPLPRIDWFTYPFTLNICICICILTLIFACRHLFWPSRSIWKTAKSEKSLLIKLPSLFSLKEIKKGINEQPCLSWENPTRVFLYRMFIFIGKYILVIWVFILSLPLAYKCLWDQDSIFVAGVDISFYLIEAPWIFQMDWRYMKD